MRGVLLALAAVVLVPFGVGCNRLVLKTNGSGAVSSSPSGSNFADGTVVTVTAVPGAGATWKGWTGSTCSGLSLSCTLTMTADTTVTANFR